MAKLKKKLDNTKKGVVLFTESKNDLLSKINFDKEMMSLTDLWREAGSPSTKRPIAWKRVESTQQLIDTLSIFLQSNPTLLWKTKRGGNKSGTYAHKSIALAYAKYLDAKLHVLVNEVFFQRIEEEKNPDLIVDRAVSTYKKRGKSEEWIGNRITGKVNRNALTATLSRHGVEREGYRNCTNATYAPLFGGTTAVIREKKNLTKDENIRDNMTALELASVQFSEALARQSIEVDNLRGNAQCEIACSKASKIVAGAISQNNKRLYNYENK